MFSVKPSWGRETDIDPLRENFLEVDLVRKRRIIVVVLCGRSSFEGPRNKEGLSGGGVGDQSVTHFSEVVVDVEVGKGHRGQRVVVYTNMFHGGISGANKGVKFDSENMVLREVTVGGGIEEGKGATCGVWWDLVAKRGKVKRKAIGISGLGGVHSVNGEGEACDEVGEKIGRWVPQVEGFGVEGPSDTKVVANFVEVDGAVGWSSITLVGNVGRGFWIIKVGYVEEEGMDGREEGEGGEEDEEKEVGNG